MHITMNKIITTKPLVYIVEDNNAYRLLLGRILEKKGYMVMMFENARKAVEMIGSVYPNLIVSDIQMPGMDGFELYNTIKKDYPKLNIPILYISSTTEIEEIRMATELSMREMLGKPVHPDVLFNSIQEALIVV